jgi:hypothetical protein
MKFSIIIFLVNKKLGNFPMTCSKNELKTASGNKCPTVISQPFSFSLLETDTTEPTTNYRNFINLITNARNYE